MGASRIQGITVEIGGDTTKLTAALKGVNGEIRTTQSQLRDVERLLKLDPGNTELLAQKHRLLAEAVRETKEKLETLKAAAEQANEALAKGEITQEQYDGLQREIIETEEKLKSLEQQANQSAVAVQKIAAVGEDLKNLGDKISGVGTTLTKSVTTPIVGLGTMAVKTAADASWQTGFPSRGGWSMPACGASPNVENASTLSQILQAGVPERYYLSPRACQGILRRASVRGKELPEVLRKALERQAASV